MAEPSTPKTAVRVGIFFVLGLIALLAFSLFVSEVRLGKDTYPLIARFKEGQGLEVGSDVTIRGVPAGTVQRIEFDPTGPEGKRVRILLSIQEKYPLPVDSVATVQFQSLLGQNYIYILDGDETQLLRPGDEILTQPGADLQKVISQFSGLGEEARGFLDELRAKSNTALDQLNAVLEENRGNLRETTQAFADAAPKIQSLTANLDSLLGDLKEGKGTIGKLLTDDTAYNNLTDVSGDLKDILAKIKSGEGTVGRLVQDDDMHEQLKTTFSDLGSAARELQGTLAENREDLRGFIEQIGELGPNLRATLDNAREISAKINEGQGTLGKLINDPSLYNDVRRAVNQIGETFEGGEEQGVIRSFFGVLFGALI